MDTLSLWAHLPFEASDVAGVHPVARNSPALVFFLPVLFAVVNSRATAFH